MRPNPPTSNGNVDSIEEAKPLDVTCKTTGSRPRATLQWTLGQKDVTFNATQWFSHNTASDTYTVISDLTYSVGKCEHGQELTCKAINVAASSGLQTSITLNVTCKLYTVKNLVIVYAILTMTNIKESYFNVSYRLQLSYGVSQTVQYTVLLESASKLKMRVFTLLH